MEVWSVAAIIYEMCLQTVLAAGKTIDDALLLLDKHVNPLNKKNGEKCVKWDYETLSKHEKITEKVAKCLIGCLKIDPNKRYSCSRALHALGVIDADAAWECQESGVEQTVKYAPLKPNYHYYDVDEWKERSRKFTEIYKRFPSQKGVIAYAIVVYDNVDICWCSRLQHFCNSMLYSAMVLGSYYNNETCYKMIKYLCNLYSPYAKKETCWDEISLFTERVITKDASLWQKGEVKSFTTFLKSVLTPPEEENRKKRQKIK